MQHEIDQLIEMYACRSITRRARVAGPVPHASVVDVPLGGACSVVPHHVQQWGSSDSARGSALRNTIQHTGGVHNCFLYL